MQLFINLLTLSLTALVAWFFFGRREEEVVSAKGKVEILVKGGYQPSVIQVKQGEAISLQFTRQDESSCLEEVVIPQLSIRQYLPMNKTTEITIKPTEAGTIPFQCGMGMFHGKIEVTT